MTELPPLRAPDRDALEAFGRWADELADPGLRFGGWIGSERVPDMPMQLPYVELGPDGMRFLRSAGELGFVQPFDWRAWLGGPEGAAYREDRSRIAGAPPIDLVRLLTSIVRSDRFNEGELLDAFESGLLLAIARRAWELAGPGGG